MTFIRFFLAALPVALFLSFPACHSATPTDPADPDYAIYQLHKMSDSRQKMAGALQLLKTSPLPQIRIQAIWILQPDSSHPEVQKALTDALQDSSSDVVIEAMKALGQAKARAAVPALLALFKPNAPPDLVIQSAHTLQEIGDEGAIPKLVDLLDQFDDMRIKYALGEALHELTGIPKVGGVTLKDSKAWHQLLLEQGKSRGAKK